MSGLYLALMSQVSIFNTTLLGFCQFAAELYFLFCKQLFAMKKTLEAFAPFPTPFCYIKLVHMNTIYT